MSVNPSQPTAADNAAATVRYHHTGAYDHAAFRTAFTAEFAGRPHYDPAAFPSMDRLLAMIEGDGKITDLRATAYMLATVFWETTCLTSERVPVRDKKGNQKRDKHNQPMFKTIRHWSMTMSPVEEVGHGKGRRYNLPVKVKRLPDGTARVTEQDGDQFTVDLKGHIKPVHKGAKVGAAATTVATKTYIDDDGEEHAYFGRGYVQLTWWSNYAAAGVSLGRGLDLLFDPDLVLEPEIAYAIMSDGMVNGHGFANKRSFSRYFIGARSDYEGARAMVNGVDHRDDIAGIARRFEKVLMQSLTTAVAQAPLR